MRTTTIPHPFNGVIWVPKTTVEIAIINTCLTLATIHSVNGEVSLLAIREQIFSENEKRPVTITTVVGQILVKISGLDIISRTSPVAKLKMRHWTIANGAIFAKRSTGCCLRGPVNISPDATTLRAAKKTQQEVYTKPFAVISISPKHAMATPMTIGMTAKILFIEICFFKKRPIIIVTAGTRDRMTWLKFTETLLRDTLPMAIFKEKITENPSIYRLPMSSS